MYLSYYKLNKNPFQINTDPNFLWLGEKHKEALSLFTYGVSSDKGFLLLTGDVGTGKTTLINAFVNSLGNQVIVARISDPGLPGLGFIKYIAEMFKMETNFETKNEFLILFTGFLEQAYRDDKKVLLIIDEAQHLSDETLEEIRLLSNIEREDKKLLNIFLVGQNEFNDTLKKHKNRALRQRLAINFTLDPFQPEETRACIAFRLSVAGAREEIFTPGAIDAIHTISKGFPRAINIICDHALLLGYQKEQEIITEEIVHQCSGELHTHLPESHEHKNVSDSTDHWLEDSEVPPLSVEALDRASQPLPDLSIVSEKEPARKTRRYLIVVPLFIAALILSGVFGFTDNTLETISQFVVNKYKETIASTVKKEETVSAPARTTQQTETPESTEVAADSKTVTPAPVKTVPTQKIRTGQQTDSGETAGIAGKTTQAEADEPAFTENPPTQASPERIGETQTDEETQAEATSSQKVKLPANQDKENLKTDPQAPLSVKAPESTLTVELPVSTGDESKNNTAATREASADEEEVTTEPEMMQLQPEPAVNQTTTEAIKDDFNKQAALPQPPAASMTEEIEPPLSIKEMTTAPEEPAATPVKAIPEREDDPGAVIDWLLKFKKDQ